MTNAECGCPYIARPVCRALRYRARVDDAWDWSNDDVDQEFRWDVAKARAMVDASEHRTALIPLRYFLIGTVYEAHVAHVDPRRPGIAATLPEGLPPDTFCKGLVVIDGHHRATRLMRDQGLDGFFPVKVLSPGESESCRVDPPLGEKDPSRSKPHAARA